jgi:hypothetical protein
VRQAEGARMIRLQGEALAAPVRVSRPAFWPMGPYTAHSCTSGALRPRVCCPCGGSAGHPPMGCSTDPRWRATGVDGSRFFFRGSLVAQFGRGTVDRGSRTRCPHLAVGSLAHQARRRIAAKSLDSRHAQLPSRYAPVCARTEAPRPKEVWVGGPVETPMSSGRGNRCPVLHRSR